MTARIVGLAALLCVSLGCDGSPSPAGETDTDSAEDSSGGTSDSSATPSTSGVATTSEPSTTSAVTTQTDPGDADSSSGGVGETDSTTGEGPLIDPRVEGEHEVEVIEVSIETEAGTTIPLTMHVPTSEGPHPVVVMLSGFLLGPSDYTSYGEHLGSWGYVVIMPELPGGTQAADRDAVVGLLDWLEGPGTIEGAVLGGRADAESLMLGGHSRGGKISFLTATADARPDALFGIDPVDSAGGPGAQPGPDNPSVAPELMPLVLAPMTIVGETTNAGGSFMSCAPQDENFQQYFAAATAPAAAIEFLTANHMSFLDDPNCGFTCSACPAGTDDPSVTRRMTQGYMVAFAEWQLRGRGGYREYLAGDFTQPDVDSGLVTIDTINGY
ncbi:MAG: chlorophyllase/cutinase-like alpha/beta fold protein [Nannocystaceae bacterium]|nr:hypothetical protein [bacterium]